MFAENTDKPKVARFLRSQSHLAHVQEAGKDTEDSVMEDATEVIAAPAAHVVAVDIYELADPVDVLVQVAPALYDKMV